LAAARLGKKGPLQGTGKRPEIGYDQGKKGNPLFQRDLLGLSNEKFDVLVLGGGAAGAATAREAALRGFKTALIEREDFSAGTSAHCFKIVHGGIRYMQHLDVRRLRASCHERAVLLRIAPHLVAPLSFVVPTYGFGKSSRWFLGTGMLLYDALTADLNRCVSDPARAVEPTRFLTKKETLRLSSSIEERGLSGAAVFQDGQMHSPPRLVLAFAQSAAAAGACISNYVEALQLKVAGQQVVGVEARDRISGDRFDVRAKVVINATGPWAEGLLMRSRIRYGSPGTYSRDASFLVNRRSHSPAALAVQGRTRDSDAVLARGTRHLFEVPWRGHTLIGVWHTIVAPDPDAVSLSAAELETFVAEYNASAPASKIDPSEVQCVDYGLVPFGERRSQKGGLSFGKQSRLIDHRSLGLKGLVSLVSVRYTVARLDAEAVLRVVESQLGRRTSVDTRMSPLTGGDIEDFRRFEASMQQQRPDWLEEDALPGLVRSYGTRLSALLETAKTSDVLKRPIAGTQILAGEATYAVRYEMATRMCDVVFRRTELGTAGHPGHRALNELQNLLTSALQWSAERARAERALVDCEFERRLARPPRQDIVRQQPLHRPQG
jgi:glycerol-3-phosphate dehydrogenase